MRTKRGRIGERSSESSSSSIWASADKNEKVSNPKSLSAFVGSSSTSEGNFSRLDSHVHQKAQKLAQAVSSSSVVQAHRTESQIRELRNEINHTIAMAQLDPGIRIQLPEDNFILDEEVLLRTRQKVDQLIADERSRRRDLEEQRGTQERAAEEARLKAVGDHHEANLARHGVAPAPRRAPAAPAPTLADRILAREQQNRARGNNPEQIRSVPGRQHGETVEEMQEQQRISAAAERDRKDPELAAERRRYARDKSRNRDDDQSDSDFL